MSAPWTEHMNPPVKRSGLSERQLLLERERKRADLCRSDWRVGRALRRHRANQLLQGVNVGRARVECFSLATQDLLVTAVLPDGIGELL